MRAFSAFIKKEFYHILRDKRTLFILIWMPIVQVLIFGYAVTNEFKGAYIAVLDQSKDQLSTELVSHLQASGHFSITENLGSFEEIHESFKKGEVEMAIVIPPEFSRQYYDSKKSQVQIIADGTEPNTATTLINYASQIITGFQREKSGVEKMPFQIGVSTRMVYNPASKSVYMFVPGVMAMILMLVSAMMTSLTLAREKELGTMELLLVSPLHPFLIIIGKVVPYILLSLLNAILILAVGVFVFGVPVKGDLFLLTMQCVLFIFTALALGVLISTRTSSQLIAMMLSLITLMMPTMLLSGFIFPIESMPVLLQWISMAIPAKYFIIILKDIMLKGSDMTFIVNETLILGGMAVFLLLISFRNFKIRLT